MSERDNESGREITSRRRGRVRESHRVRGRPRERETDRRRVRKRETTSEIDNEFVRENKC